MDLIASYNQAVRLMERLERRAKTTNHGVSLLWPDAKHEHVYYRALARAKRRYAKVARVLLPPRR